MEKNTKILIHFFGPSFVILTYVPYNYLGLGAITPPQGYSVSSAEKVWSTCSNSLTASFIVPRTSPPEAFL